MNSPFNIANQIDIANPVANLDKRYGPYASVADACAGVPASLRKGGRTVGVYVAGKVVDYYWPSDDALADADLTQKVTSSGGESGNATVGELTIAAITELDRVDLTDGVYLVKGAVEGYLFQITVNSVITHHLHYADKVLTRKITVSEGGTDTVKSYPVLEIQTDGKQVRLDSSTHLEEEIDTSYVLTRVYNNTSSIDVSIAIESFMSGDDTVVLAEALDSLALAIASNFEFTKYATVTVYEAFKNNSIQLLEVANLASLDRTDLDGEYRLAKGSISGRLSVTIDYAVDNVTPVSALQYLYSTTYIRRRRIVFATPQTYPAWESVADKTRTLYSSRDRVINMSGDDWANIATKLVNEGAYIILDADDSSNRPAALPTPGQDETLQYNCTVVGNDIDNVLNRTLKMCLVGTSREFRWDLDSSNTVVEFKGEKGDKGDKGDTGAQGIQGIQGTQGAAGTSAYAAAVAGGFTGTEAQFNAYMSLISSFQTKPTTHIIHETGSGISIDLNYTETQVVLDAGYTNAIALDTFTNLPAENCERCVNFLNNRATSGVITPRTTSLTVSGVTYTFASLDAATKTVITAGRCEISLKFLQQATNSFLIIYSIK